MLGIITKLLAMTKLQCTRAVRFRQRGQAAVEFSLLPSMTAIHFSRTSNSNNTLTPSSHSLYCGYRRVEGDTSQDFIGNDWKNTCTNTITKTGQSGSGTAPYNIFYRYQKSDGTFTNWSWAKDMPANSSSAGLTISSGTSYTAVEYALSSSASYASVSDANIIDRVVIPISKDGRNGQDGIDGIDGDDGQDAPAAFVTPGSLSIPCDKDGKVIETVQQSLTFSMSVGSHAATNVSASVRGSLPSGVSYSNGVLTINVNSLATNVGSGASFTVTGTYDGDTYSAVCTLAIIPARQGQSITGHTGRFYYYAGSYDSSKTYSMKQTQAPYVSMIVNGTRRFYMLDFKGVEPSSFPASATKSPTANGQQEWTQMDSEHEYFIARAIFGDFAHLGSLIICGDWMLSQHGTINGSESDDYEEFDANDPRGQNSGNFAPHFCVNMLAGRGYWDDAFIRGEFEGLDGYLRIYGTRQSMSYHGQTINWVHNFLQMFAADKSTALVTVMTSNDSGGKGFVGVSNYDNDEYATVSPESIVVVKTEGDVIQETAEMRSNLVSLEGKDENDNNLSVSLQPGKIQFAAQSNSIPQIEFIWPGNNNRSEGVTSQVTIGSKRLTFVAGILVRVTDV